MMSFIFVIPTDFKSLKIPNGNQNPYIEEQTTQWPKEKVQKDKQRSIKHTYKTKRSNNTNPTKHRGWNQVLRKGKQFLLDWLTFILIVVFTSKFYIDYSYWLFTSFWCGGHPHLKKPLTLKKFWKMYHHHFIVEMMFSSISV